MHYAQSDSRTTVHVLRSSLACFAQVCAYQLWRVARASGVDVYVVRIAGRKFAHDGAFEHGGARPGAFSVRFHRLQGILDLVGDAPFGLFVGMAVAVPRTFFVLFGIRVLCLGVLVTMGGSSSPQVPGWMCARYILSGSGRPRRVSRTLTLPSVFVMMATPLTPESLVGWSSISVGMARDWLGLSCGAIAARPPQPPRASIRARPINNTATLSNHITFATTMLFALAYSFRKVGRVLDHSYPPGFTQREQHTGRRGRTHPSNGLLLGTGAISLFTNVIDEMASELLLWRFLGRSRSPAPLP